ncbi:hypothetical protein Q4Q34_04960 [Flavivirga abyssicola]|uniref:hypothetical protein n=1 Tax=Flavivirga abyssicola TaxID=3063533 RepID=UPI0026E074A3|nr:hypothetical protein [Flavivirga sp. MEBiC07777]WVK14376.1 hypothetical protein Q4Q34_04960 [Flavivirga sp. MEBiC07777]
MKYTIYLFLLLSCSIHAQKAIETSFIKKANFKASQLITIDNFETKYFIRNNVFNKKDAHTTITYNNLQLGNITTANAFNPLKINLFYKDFNSVIILDNRLAEIFKIDFNALPKYKNASHISTGHDNTIWVFDENNQKLELFDYRTLTTRAQTVPIQSTILDLKSNYNFCFLLTKNYLYTYNYFGSLVKRIKNDGYTQLAESNGDIFLKKENDLFYLKKGSETTIPILIPNLLINAFFVTNETLYIYANEILHEYKIKID